MKKYTLVEQPLVYAQQVELANEVDTARLLGFLQARGIEAEVEKEYLRLSPEVGANDGDYIVFHLAEVMVLNEDEFLERFEAVADE